METETSSNLPSIDSSPPSPELSSADKDAIARVFNAFKSGFSSYKNRRQQRVMIANVAQAFSNKRISMIEAPTGTGKSASYLIPGIALAKLQKKKLVVSTATASLQDQLARSDLPRIAQACFDAGLGHVDFALAKGRERHLCVTKFNLISTQGALFTEEDELHEVNLIRTAWESNGWNGVRDSLEQNISTKTWSKFNNTKETCTGRGCADVDDCPYYLGLDALAEADVIITNHDYLLACLLNNPQSVLSQCEDNFYVFDEAHHLAEKCISVFKTELNLSDDELDDVLSAVELTGHDVGRIATYINTNKQHLKELELSAQDYCSKTMLHRFPYGVAEQSFLDLLLRYQHSLQQVFNLFEVAFESYMERTGANSALTFFARMRLNMAKSVLRIRLSSVDAFLNVDEDKARWICKRKDKLTLSSSPFDAARLARKHLWSQIKVCVLTSATFGELNAARMRLGLSNATQTSKLDTPLDHTNSRMIVPQLALSGSNSKHSSMVAAYIKRDAFSGRAQGVLVYFTSRQQMIQVYESLDADSKAMTLLQGAMPPTQIISLHKERINGGQQSVIFGLDSFAEGVDLPGNYCALVIITKLPFPSPDNPVLATHCEILEREGRNPFNLLMLPIAAIKFAQICGRLIRREGDLGDIEILDDRIITKRYANRMLTATAYQKIELVD